MAFAKGIAAGTLRWARGQEGRFDAPLSSSGLHSPLTKKGLLAPFRPQSRSRSGKMLAASLKAFFALLRFESPSAAAAAAPRRGARAPSPSAPDGRIHLSLRERQEAFPSRSWLSLRESWREAPERVRSPAGRDRRKIKIIFPLNIAQSEAEGILNPVFVVLKSQNPEKPAQKRLKAVQKRFWMCYTNK